MMWCFLVDPVHMELYPTRPAPLGTGRVGSGSCNAGRRNDLEGHNNFF